MGQGKNWIISSRDSSGKAKGTGHPMIRSQIMDAMTARHECMAVCVGGKYKLVSLSKVRLMTFSFVIEHISGKYFASNCGCTL